MGEVAVGDSPRWSHSVGLARHRIGNRRVLSQQTPGPPQRARHGFVAGDDEGDQLITDLFDAQRLVVFVTNRQQHSQEVCSRITRPRGHHRRHRCVQPGDRPLEDAIGGCGKPRWWRYRNAGPSDNNIEGLQSRSGDLC